MWLASRQISTLLFESMKEYFRDHKLHNSEEVEMAVHKWLQMQEPNFHCNTTQKLLPACMKCINALKDYTDKR